MKHGDIRWFIEHTARELDVAAAVATLVEKKYGRTIGIHPLSLIKKASAIPSPALVLLPFFYSLADAGFADMVRAWPNALFFNVSWEQVFYTANLEYKAPKDTFAKQYVYHHAWSREREAFLKQKGVPANHIFVNGHPAYSLYKKPYRDVFVKRAELSRKFGIDKSKRWVFFPENFSWFFYSEHQLEHIIKSGQDRAIAYQMRDYCKDAFHRILDWLDEASKDPHVAIILRPRPAFSLSYFSEKLQAVAPGLNRKIFILKEYSVREWILASDVVVSTFSTSLIEAAVAGKPLFMLEPAAIPKGLSAPWYERVEKIKNRKEFISRISEKRAGSPTLLAKWAEERFFVNKDPIDGLARYIGTLPLAQKKTEQKDFITAQVKSSGIAHRLKEKAGLLKRYLSGTTAYYRNDDEDRYYRHIEERKSAFQSFFKTEKSA